ncbi:MAG: sugar porter family MFS transporter [Kiritimatiellae bacterium]|nr:sugar porter family MFS transporter [Kiritimatiellia bacterium]
MTVKGYAKYLLVMAGLGGLLYGVDVGVIAAALPYIERTSTFSQDQIGLIVGMALWGSLPSSLVAGLLAEWFGRKKMIVASAMLFLISIPVICASGFFDGGNFWMMVAGRAMQGAAAGLFGVIVPMYLAECLDADSRGKGTGMFQLLLTIGLVFVAVIGFVVTSCIGDAKIVVDGKAIENGIVVYEQKTDASGSPVWKVDATGKALVGADGEKIPELAVDESGKPKPKLDREGKVIVDAKKIDFKLIKSWVAPEKITSWVRAWQMIFLLSCVPGLVLFVGAFRLKESSRWLYRKGRKDEAVDSLAANNGEEKAREILAEMIAADEAAAAEKAKNAAATDTLFQKKYVIPFILAVVILACNQTTGINSVLNYTVTIFQKTGMQGAFANVSDVAIKIMNCVMTIVACALVDKKGRKFLLKLGTSGIIVGLCGVGTIFLAISKQWVVPSMTTGVLATVFFFMFIGFYAVGPGVCVWLALTELMPTRIRANGMAIAMIINQGVSAGIATVFPKWCAATNDNGTVFFVLAGFTVVYFITAAFFLPETKGRTLEEVEKYFTTGKMPEKK